MSSLTANHSLKRVMPARQANHHSYILPRELWQYEENALYKYIARWSYLRQEYICCDDVAANFGISVRQATNILSMIHRRYSNVFICRVKRIKAGKGNVVKTHLLVTEIKQTVRKKMRKDVECKSRSQPDLQFKQLRDAFLSCKPLNQRRADA